MQGDLVVDTRQPFYSNITHGHFAHSSSQNQHSHEKIRGTISIRGTWVTKTGDQNMVTSYKTHLHCWTANDAEGPWKKRYQLFKCYCIVCNISRKVCVVPCDCILQRAHFNCPDTWNTQNTFEFIFVGYVAMDWPCQ